MNINISSFLQKEFSKDALRNIILIILPACILFFTAEAHIAIAFAVGVLLSCLTDLPGNKQDKWLTAKWCIPLFFITSLTICSAEVQHSWIILVVLLFMGFFYTLISILSFRISIVGNLGLIVASFTIGLRPSDPISFSLALTAGAIFYFIVSLIQVYFRPYRSLKYAMEEGIFNMSKLIKLKIACYDENSNLATTYKDLSILHIKVSDQLENIRSLLLREKALLNGNDEASKFWLSKLYYLVDLYELLMAVDKDYETTRSLLKDTGSLPVIRLALDILSDQIENLNDSNKSTNFQPLRKGEFDALLKQLQQLEDQETGSKKILIHSINAHLNQISTILSNINTETSDSNNSWVQNQQYSSFVTSQNSIKTIWKSISFKSPICIYAIRMAILLVFAGLIGYLLPEFRYASWIMLTIILVAKPTYINTQKRNYQRILGSFIGIIISLGILYSIDNNVSLSVIAIISLYLYLLFNKPNYLVCVIFITITIVIFQSIYEGNPIHILGSRFSFTIIGSVFAVLGCLAIPINQFQTVEKSTDSLIKNFKIYLSKIQENIASEDVNFYDLRLMRKFTQTALAQCYDNLNQLEKAPSTKGVFTQQIHQFESLAYRVNALLVGLSLNITKFRVDLGDVQITDRIKNIENLIFESEVLLRQITHQKENTLPN